MNQIFSSRRNYWKEENCGATWINRVEKGSAIVITKKMIENSTFSVLVY